MTPEKTLPKPSQTSCAREYVIALVRRRLCAIVPEACALGICKNAPSHKCLRETAESEAAVHSTPSVPLTSAVFRDDY